MIHGNLIARISKSPRVLDTHGDGSVYQISNTENVFLSTVTHGAQITAICDSGIDIEIGQLIEI